MNHTAKVLIATIFIITLISAGIYFQEEYDPRSNLWSPIGNISEKNLNKAKALFSETNRLISVLITNKKGGNILTQSQFVEMK